MPYLITVPPVIRMLYGNVVWEMPADEKAIYMTFDDGPHATETEFVLEQLKAYNAKATFFCIGKNVEMHPRIYEKILQEGHAVGNHTHSHLDGWKTSAKDYHADINNAAAVIITNLFRPPYGKITPRQAMDLKKRGWQTIMWSVISADFDNEITPEKCIDNVMRHAKPGAIVVFHDSTKASYNLRHALPKVLEELSGEGYLFRSI